MRILLHLTIAAALLAQAPPPAPDITIDAATRNQVIDGACRVLVDGYVYLEVAKKMEQHVRDRQQKKAYDAISSARQFAEALTAHLREVSRDKHIRVIYSPVATQQGPVPEQERLSQMRRNNYGFEKVERLAGNIGYLDLRGFLRADLMSDTAAAAMNFVTNTDALIIDLRKNGGGDPAAVALLSSYLYGPGEIVHLNDLYWRASNETQKWFTLASVPGKRYPKKDVYILTSHFTFSAAEEFTYNLKNLKRATIVGETTGGGAHPGGTRRVHPNFMVNVPSGRAINPISKTNWEGTGVEPDVKVAEARALKTAHLMALEKRLPATASLVEELKKELAAGN